MIKYQNPKEYIQNTKDLDLSYVYEKFMFYIKKGKLLDLGCGSGRDSLYFIKNGFDVVATDGYAEMCLEASKNLGKEVLHLPFNDINYKNEFDAIWACASLLHVPNNELNDILLKISNAMKKNAYFYSSFKHGDKEVKENGLIYNYETKESFQQKLPSNLKLLESFISKDTLNNSRPEWINFIVQKINNNSH